MKWPYQLFQRSNAMYFIEDRFTRSQANLRTKDKHIAARILNARNEAQLQPVISRESYKAYWAGHSFQGQARRHRRRTRQNLRRAA